MFEIRNRLLPPLDGGVRKKMKRRNFFQTIIGAAAVAKAAPSRDPNRILSNQPTKQAYIDAYYAALEEAVQRSEQDPEKYGIFQRPVGNTHYRFFYSNDRLLGVETAEGEPYYLYVPLRKGKS